MKRYIILLLFKRIGLNAIRFRFHSFVFRQSRFHPVLFFLWISYVYMFVYMHYMEIARHEKRIMFRCKLRRYMRAEWKAGGISWLESGHTRDERASAAGRDRHLLRFNADGNSLTASIYILLFPFRSGENLHTIWNKRARAPEYIKSHFNIMEICFKRKLSTSDLLWEYIYTHANAIARQPATFTRGAPLSIYLCE